MKDGRSSGAVPPSPPKQRRFLCGLVQSSRSQSEGFYSPSETKLSHTLSVSPSAVAANVSIAPAQIQTQRQHLSCYGLIVPPTSTKMLKS